MKTLNLRRFAPLVLCALLLFLSATVSASPAQAEANCAPPTAQLLRAPSNSTPIPAATSSAPTSTVSIICPLEIYKITADGARQPVDQLVDDFEVLPERWLYVLTPLAADESYLIEFDVACRTETAALSGDLVAIYSNDLWDGDLGGISVTIRETLSDQIAIDYTGEIRFVADGQFHLDQVVDVAEYSDNFHDYKHFSFRLTTSTSKNPTENLQEIVSYHLDSARAKLNVAIIGDHSYVDSVYAANLTPYMYPFGNLPDNWQISPETAFPAALPALPTQISRQSHALLPYRYDSALCPVHHTLDDIPAVG